MTKLEQLIKELCLNGVEYKSLGDTCSLVTGATPSKTNPAYWENGTIPWMSSGEVNNKIVYDTETKITQLGYDKTSTSLVPVHSVVIALAGQGKTRGKVAITEIELCTNQSLCSIICGKELNYKFLYYYLDSKYEELREISNGDGTRGGLSLRILKPYVIPVPSLEVQAEIVKILDNFTELTAELTARKKQYEYYKQQILPLYSQVKTVRLEEISDIIDSLHKTPKYSDFGYSMIRVQDVKNGYIIADDTLKVDKETFDEFVKKYKPQIGDIVVSRVGSYGNFAIINDDNCCLGQNVALIHPRINIKYIFYFLNSSYTKSWIQNNVNGASQKSLSIADIKRIPIPVPPIEEQERIVSILDRFDKLCNDISEGLPAEIEARRKQYEYYRDKMLSFNEA